MIFATTNAIQDIISGKKTQTRRLVKEGEELYFAGTSEFPNKVILFSKKGKIKWKVNGIYAVQSGRGKPCVWYCRRCNAILWNENIGDERTRALQKRCACFMPVVHNLHKPLRIRITNITKQKLLDIDESDAHKEGFETYSQFCHAFHLINRAYWRKLKVTELLSEWNPDVWVISFEAVK